VISEAARTFLARRDAQRAGVWVFFTDKGILGQAEFESAARACALSDRASRRRTRTGTAEILFVDLPVFAPYVNRLEQQGAQVRRYSRWLNAVSVEVRLDRLDELAALSCVAEIRPVARFRRPEEVPALPRSAPPTESQSEEAFDYGESQTQIYQIKAAVAHAQGLSGRGVTLTMTDTGFRKTHEALAGHLEDGRMLAEYDFIMNDGNTGQEPGDAAGQWSHGTLTWSVAGGFAPGHVIGPAYGANFILCKTEDVVTETPIEEDNWVAALEYADSIGTDVISTSLGYSDWYDYSDMDGQTAVISIAAGTCDGLGIVMATSAGNDGPAAGTIIAPADAYGVLAVGAVDAIGTIAAFSSRGPTFDGRLKPEVCALGVDAFGASAGGDQFYRYASGTSLSAPLVAGAACLLLEARPELSPELVREALRATADHATGPDNTYGWGIIDLEKALTWPVNFAADRLAGQVPLTVSFSNQSSRTPDSLAWTFGDGSFSVEPDPVHVFETPGVFDVTLTLDTDLGRFTQTVPGMISVHADTLSIPHLEATAGSKVRLDVYARNFLPLREITVPFSWDGSLDIMYDSFSTAGLRTEYLSTQALVSYAPSMGRAALTLRSAVTPTEPQLAPGHGPVVSLYFSVPFQSWAGTNPIRLISYAGYQPSFRSGSYAYVPALFSGSLRLGCCFGQVGDVDGVDGEEPTVADVVLLIDHLFISKIPLPCWAEADANQSGGAGAAADDISIGDVAVLLDYLFISGPSTGLPDCY